MNPDLESFNTIVRGRVQGVFFRDFVRYHATTLKLVGYVRNLPQGRAVEVRAEGEREQLQKLLQHLRQGPPMARVEKVEVEWTVYTGNFSSFEVKY